MSAIDNLIEYLDEFEKTEFIQRGQYLLKFNPKLEVLKEIRAVAERLANEEKLQKAIGKLGLTDVVSENE